MSSWAVRPGPVRTPSNYFTISSFHSSFLFILKFAIFMLVIVTMVFQTTLYSLQCRQKININAKLQRWRKDDDDWACQADWWVVEPPWNRLQCASPIAFLGGDMHTLGFRPRGEALEVISQNICPPPRKPSFSGVTLGNPGDHHQSDDRNYNFIQYVFITDK